MLQLTKAVIGCTLKKKKLVKENNNNNTLFVGAVEDLESHAKIWAKQNFRQKKEAAVIILIISICSNSTKKL